MNDEELGAASRLWIEEAVGPGARIVRVAQMPQAQMRLDAIDVEDAHGATHELVLRRYEDSERLAGDPWYRPRNEVTALELLEPTPVPAPRLLAHDLHGRAFDTPALLTTRLPGSVVTVPADLDDYLEQLARMLPLIHAIDGAGRLPDYAPYYPDDRLVPPPWSERPGLWERVFEVATGPAPPSRRCFIHRDYHPYNVLWVDGRISGVLDWPTAAWGPPGIDLARLRLDVAHDIGPDVAERFLRIHAAVTDEGDDHDPHWDLVDLADCIPDATPPVDAEEAASWARFEEYAARVLALL
jgi:aminoglycoside phosphotransferase (APT) family kinase protein